MGKSTVAVLMTGDMGHGVGRALQQHGHTAITALEGRSARSRELCKAAGIADAGTITGAVEQADIILSILPPASAPELARDVAAAMEATGCKPVYVDCNAVSPTTAIAIGETITAAGAPFIDGGIIGPSPGKPGGTRFYVSGTGLEPVLGLGGSAFSVTGIGDEPGRASALKMAYAGLTKGTFTLHTAVLMAARQLGVLDDLMQEFEISQAATLKAMAARVPFLPANAGRWIGEMEEIAATFDAAGVPRGFHDGAAEIFRTLARTPLASETPETTDRTRSIEAALAVYCAALDDEQNTGRT